MPKSFRALLVSEAGENEFTREIVERSVDDLPAGEVLIRVHYSSLNYKDALSATGNPGVTRKYPHTPGIDAAGLVEESASADFQPGDQVVVTGYDLGMNTDGGFAGRIRVPAAWVVPLPAPLSLRESMIYGTAGFTAAVSTAKLEAHGVTPGDGEVLVTGATGGVGSLAVAMLAKRGYRVVASTGKAHEEAFLRDLGAATVISREEVRDTRGRPLLRERWAGAVDTVGGDTLGTVIKSTRYGGAITCCGLVASAELPVAVFPFILRGVALLGVASADTPMGPRLEAWKKIAGDYRIESVERVARECGLEELNAEIDRMLQGGAKGRVVVNLID